MVVQILTLIVPIFFVLVLGYVAGKARAFDSDQVTGISNLVFEFALPASLFVGTVRTPRAQLLQQLPLFLALCISIVGFYLVVVVLSRWLFRKPLGEAALQALNVSFPAAPFFGPALLSGLYGPGSSSAIGLLSITTNIFIVPMTFILLGIAKAAKPPGKKASLGALMGHTILHAFKSPIVLAPLLASVLVLGGVTVPALIDTSLDLIGETTAGVALFVAGLIVAARKITVSKEVGVNMVLKMVIQPALFFVVMVVLQLKPPFGPEGFLMCAMSPTVICTIVATQYHTYEEESSSTLAISTIVMIVTLPIALFLVGGS